jgi:D-tyrosyl-tRNA(Tyr) deacylase
MRAVVQRVAWARVRVAESVVGEIGPGLLVLLGAQRGDAEPDVERLAEKTVHLRVFEDEAGALNRSLLEIGGALLVVSQFTLLGDCRKGRRPSFIDALEPVAAEALCTRFVELCRGHGAPVETGRFRAMMEVELCNSGPVTLLLDSRRAF